MLGLLAGRTNPFRRNSQGLSLVDLARADSRVAKEVFEMIHERFRRLFFE
jgi:hypothetical protein